MTDKDHELRANIESISFYLSDATAQLVKLSVVGWQTSQNAAIDEIVGAMQKGLTAAIRCKLEIERLERIAQEVEPNDA